MEAEGVGWREQVPRRRTVRGAQLMQRGEYAAIRADAELRKPLMEDVMHANHLIGDDVKEIVQNKSLSEEFKARDVRRRALEPFANELAPFLQADQGRKQPA